MSHFVICVCYFLFLCQLTPLHMAAEGGYMKIVEYLFENGADVKTTDNTGVIRFETAILAVD